MAGGFFILGDSISAVLEVLGTGDNLDAVEEVASRALSDAQFNAPWADRTGSARDGLDIDVSKEGDSVVVTLMHTVDYGQWLETIQSGRFAIIMPTLDKYAPEIQKAVAEGISSGG